jgi:hypothetical protein
MKYAIRGHSYLVAVGILASLVVMPAGVLIIMGQIYSPAWPRRAAVRIEPARGRLKAAAVTPDNGFYYLRQLVQLQDDLERLREPVQQPQDEVASMFPDPALVRTGLSTPLGDEAIAISGKGYQPGAYPLHDRLLEQAAPALELCAQAAACPKAQVPTLDCFDYDLPYLGPLSASVRLLAFRLEKRASGGDWPGVTEDARTAATCARQIACGGGVCNHLVGDRLVMQVCTSLRRLALTKEVPPDTARTLVGLLAETEACLEPPAEGLRVERLAGLHLVEIVVGKEKGFDSDVERFAPYPRPLLWIIGSTEARMERHATDCFSLLIRDAEEPYNTNPAGWTEIAEFIRGSRARFPFGLLGSDPMGRVVAMVLMPGMARLREREVMTRAVLRGTATVLAIQAWRQLHGGRPPQRLDQLVPVWFPEIPGDPCAIDPRTPLRYLPDDHGWRLYSIGPDQVDDGGPRRPLGPGTELSWNLADICFHSDEFASVPDAGDD